MFICDRTVGRLSKWLRILGFETHFLRTVDDIELIAHVMKKDNSIFITRNMDIFIKIGKKEKYLLKAADFRQQIREVSKLFPLGWAENIFTKCLMCGNNLLKIDRDDIKDSVPDYIFEDRNEFKICPICDKIYWRGSHYNRIISELKNIFPEKFC